jgi:hypothetical protein
MILLGLVTAGIAPALWAQVERTDVLWARDVAGAGLTLDGNLDEAVWAQAESVELTWETVFAPGGGRDNFFGNFNAPGIEPSDPVDATVRILRDGDVLWLGVDVRDKSIGGSPTDFWTNDGFWFQIVDKAQRTEAIYDSPHSFNGAHTDEFFYNWLDSYEVGGLPVYHGNNVAEGAPTNDIWEAATVVDGSSSDDAHGDDVGYTMEIWVDLAKLGYDLDAGESVPMSFAVYDHDYEWPADIDRKYLTRAWWQNPWGADFATGVGYVMTDAAVTVASGDVPEVTEPDLVIPRALSAGITIDGMLDEQAWQDVEPQVTLQYQMSLAELDALPGVGPYYTHWFRPGGDDENAPPVADPSTGQIRFFYRGTVLYVGLDTDDQAISGDLSEDRADGLGVTIRAAEPTIEGQQYAYYWVRVAIDSSGAPVLTYQRPGEASAPWVEAAVHLKGSSTAADPSDIDEGYQIELAINLATLLGYEGGLDVTDNVIWIGANYFDGDYLQDIAQSYGMRTWWLTERGGGPAAMALLDANTTVASEDRGEVPSKLVLLGNYPNPFNPATRVRFALPQAGRVTLDVFDVLGRAVATQDLGLQAAGTSEATFSAEGLPSGLYLYRVQVADAATGAARSSVMGRMMLVK